MLKSFRVLYLLLVIPVLSEHRSDDGPSWYYPESESWPETCKGKKQSPIDIKDDDTETEDTFPALELVNYDKEIKVDIVNDGHTVMLKVDPQDNLYITGSYNEDATYYLKQIHFHWESEHRIENKIFPLEVHFVHELKTAKENFQDIHVLSALYHITKSINIKLGTFFSSLPSVQNLGDENTTHINPRNLLPNVLTEFYRYEGSLTVPNCTENVLWTVFNSKVPISKEQYNAITSLETFNGTNSQTFRNPQPLNERKLQLIYSSGNGLRLSKIFKVLTFFILVTKFVKYLM